jgi:hypothetical protein
LIGYFEIRIAALSLGALRLTKYDEGGTAVHKRIGSAAPASRLCKDLLRLEIELAKRIASATTFVIRL